MLPYFAVRFRKMGNIPHSIYIYESICYATVFYLQGSM